MPNPIFNLTPTATVDEGNNWVNISWGPLAETNPVSGVTLGNYALATGSPAIDYIPTNASSYGAAPTTDYFGNPRPDVRNSPIDIGAVEFQGGGGAAVASVTGGPLTFNNVVDGATSAAQTLTLHNTGGANLTGIVVTTSSAVFSRAGGTCGATLAAGTTCTITVTFSPVAPPGAASGTLSIAASVAVAGSPVALSGTGVAAVTGATLTPATWTTAARHGVGGGLIPCVIGGGPCQAFTLTNTGNVTLTGIAQGVLGGANAADYFVSRLLSTCGPAGGGQLMGITTLAPGATCTVTVQFRPVTTDPVGSVRAATVSVTDVAGTQSSNLSGTVQ